MISNTNCNFCIHNPFPLNDTFWWVWERRLLKTLWEKRICLYKQFILFPQCFLLYQSQKLSFFVPFVICKCFQFGLVQKFVVWEWFNPFPNKPWFLRVCSKSLLKTLQKKEKLLVTSNFFLFLQCF